MQKLNGGGTILTTRPAPNPQGATYGYAVNNASSPAAATVADPDCVNAIVAEIETILAAAGITDNPAVVNQLYTALQTLFAPLVSPVFTGTPEAPTPATNDDSTKLATTAFIASAIAACVTGTSSSFKLPNGYIVQFGTYSADLTATGIATFSVALPEAFPTNCFFTLANWSGTAPPSNGASVGAAAGADLAHIKLSVNSPSVTSYLLAFLAIGN